MEVESAPYRGVGGCGVRGAGGDESDGGIQGWQVFCGELTNEEEIGGSSLELSYKDCGRDWSPLLLGGR